MVRDNTELGRYELEVPGGTGFVTYRRTPGVVTLVHTEVPENIGRKGVGTELVKGALDDLRARGEKVIPRCKFVAAFIAKHPEYQDLVAPQS
ncbi:MAG TPA: GNAT family N-acetyltransferase [Polyangiaceae bacterium]|jgi:hypothetical protein|nr:GNAT family N-acetyltransferase [Polyangiaceae bacterium]